ncbi:hypothetical protein KX816_04160 [Sphingosinicellaceae bacterium]|nr:hypothetical protein KX816_04160 [Sphingosinicellaceae bacterium]
MSAPIAAAASVLPATPLVWRLTLLMALALTALTAADIATTLVALRNGGIELNNHVSDGKGGLDIGKLVLVNLAVLSPLVIGYFIAMRKAHHVPGPVLDHWWRHVFDIFTVSPRSDAGRSRAPLRLATAAMVMIVLKALIVGSNVLVALRIQNPTSLIADMFSAAGLSGPGLWKAAYAVLIIPCYIAAVGLAALTLTAVQRERTVKAVA